MFVVYNFIYLLSNVAIIVKNIENNVICVICCVFKNDMLIFMSKNIKSTRLTRAEHCLWLDNIRATNYNTVFLSLTSFSWFEYNLRVLVVRYSDDSLVMVLYSVHYLSTFAARTLHPYLVNEFLCATFHTSLRTTCTSQFRVKLLIK